MAPLRASLLLLGAASAGVQLVLLRELMSIFAGNELVTGTALGVWLLLSGAGSAAASRLFRRVDPSSVLPWLHLSAGLLPLLLLVAARALPLILGTRGQLLGLPAALGGSALLFLPAGFLAGAIIPLAGRIWTAEAGLQRDQVARSVYALDSAGDALGGLLFSFLLVHILPHGWTLAVYGWLNLSLIPFLLEPKRRKAGVVLSALAALLLVSAGAADQWSAAWRYPGQKILLRWNTPFAELAVTRAHGQINVFQDAVPVYSTGDRSAEARVHPALAQVPPGSSVLLIGGGIFGGVEEAAKHQPERIDFIELDPALLKLAAQGEFAPSRRSLEEGGGLQPPSESQGKDRILPGVGHPGESYPGIEIRPLAGDGRLFLKGIENTYDAILVDMPPPTTAQGNRYYTEEFFREALRALRPGGVVSFPLPASPNYLGPEQIALERSVFSALRASFRHVQVLPGEIHIFLASNRRLDLNLESILAHRGVETVRLLDYDWPEYSDPFRREELASILAGANREGAGPGSVPQTAGRSAAESAAESAPVRSAVEAAGPGLAPPNRDLSPRAFEALLRRQTRITAQGEQTVWILAAGFLLLAVLSMGRGRTRWIVGTTGFAVMALQLEALLIYQVLLGHLYLRLALFVTLFLIGAAAGSQWIPLNPERARRRIRTADAVLMLAGLLLAATAFAGTRTSDPRLVRVLADGLLPLLVLLTALAAGAQFAAAGAVAGARGRGGPERSPEESGSLVAGLYLADLAGAASGTIVTGLVLLPHFGLGGVTAVVLAVKGAALLFAARK